MNLIGYHDDKTLVFLWQLMEKMWVDRNSFTLYQERDLRDMIDGFVYDTIEPCREKIKEMKNPIDDEILVLEKKESQEWFSGQWELQTLEWKQEVLEKVLDILDI